VRCITKYIRLVTIRTVHYQYGDTGVLVLAFCRFAIRRFAFRCAVLMHGGELLKAGSLKSVDVDASQASSRCSYSRFHASLYAESLSGIWSACDAVDRVVGGMMM
jgi:hypothetical protein